MQPTSRGRLRLLRGGAWEESRQFSQPDASLPALPALAATASNTLSRPPVPAGASKPPSLVPIEKVGRGLASEGAALAHSFHALPKPPTHPQAPVSRTNRRSKTWPRKRGCSPGSLPACAALPRPPLTTARDVQCTGPSYAHCSAMLSTQPCLHPQSFSTKMGRTGNRHRVGRATRISCRKPRNSPRGRGRRNPLSPHGMHSSLAIVTELGGK